MLCMSNFIFIVGVQSSKNIIKCEIIAILLHYFHLATAIWGLIYIATLYQFIEKEIIFNLRNNYIIAYCGPAIYVMLSYAISSTSYEIHNYCWMSVQRGMIVNFMIPVSILIVISTILGTISLRKIVAKQRQVIGESIESIMESAAIKYEPSNVTASPHLSAVVNNQLNINNSSNNNNNNNLNTDLQNHLTTVIRSCDHIETNGFENFTNDDDFMKSKLDLYDSKYNLAALSLADLSLQSTSDVPDYADYKKAVRFSLFFEPTFGVCWFLGVVALENSHISCILPVIFIICYNIMCWCLLIKISIIYPMINISTSSSSSSSKHNLSSTSLNKTTSRLNESPTATRCGSIKKFTEGIQMSSNQAICTDTIPLLCSTSSGINNCSSNIVNSSNSNINQNDDICNEQVIEWETINLDTNNTNSTTIYDCTINASNYDCISTISS